jgi:predicted metal-dependent phosphoesterase TrpH
VAHGLAKNVQKAFDKYLGKGQPFYAAKEGQDFTEACRVIHNAGGLAVIAHPLSTQIALSKMPEFFAFLKSEGLDGVEAFHPNATVHKCKRLEADARALGLRISAGSDFHGKLRPDRQLGRTAGGMPIDEHIMEELFA